MGCLKIFHYLYPSDKSYEHLQYTWYEKKDKAFCATEGQNNRLKTRLGTMLQVLNS